MSAIVDPIADLLTRVRNAHKAKHADVEAPHSKLLEAVAHVLCRQGYIAAVEVDGEKPHKVLRLTLKYKDGDAVIAGTRRISRPSRRIYAGCRDIPRVRNGLGIVVLSTSEGILTGKEAKQRNLGGEVLCYVW